ncbi:MAG TPA: rhodanese-like domain-containing protein [Myxococcota bacterium]|nr:rhodanese-like domain-containing protein [Myxococcota bacterium]
MPAWLDALLATTGTLLLGPPDADAERRALLERIAAGLRQAFPDVPTVEAEALLQRLGEPGLTLVDVREPHERAVSTLPGAVPLDDAPATGPLVCYCTIGWRSGLAARRLRQRGVDAHNLPGSVLLWTHVGGPLVHDGAPTRSVHVWDARWSLAASAFEAVW